jgi:hypothetical protein
MVNIAGTPYEYDTSLKEKLDHIAQRVDAMRSAGRLSPEVLGRLRRFFKVKNYLQLERHRRQFARRG